MINFSVVIPLFNKQNQIQRAIQSVLSQTYPHFELIIVNDGSTDESLQKASEIIDNRIRIISQSNQGVSAARNRGVAEAKYDYIALLDADDEWLPDYFEHMKKLMNLFPDCGLFGSNYFVEYQNRNNYESARYPYLWKGVLENYFQDLLLFPPFCSSSVIIKRSILEKISGFPEFIFLGEDTNTWIRLFLITKFAFLNMPLAIYHKETDNFSKMYSKKFLENGYFHTNFLRDLLNNEPKSKIYKNEILNLISKYEYPIIRSHILFGKRIEALKRLFLIFPRNFLQKKWWLLFFNLFFIKNIKQIKYLI